MGGCAVTTRNHPASAVRLYGWQNASDIALVIDAMDLLHSGRFDAFCIVSSDSDFTRLATRIREHGLSAYGFGDKRAPQSFQQACHRFICMEDLIAAPAPVVAVPASAKTGEVQPVSAAAALIKKALAQAKTKDGWIALSDVGKQLMTLRSDFDTRTYGYSKLTELVRETRAFEIQQPKTGAAHVLIRLPVANITAQEQKRQN